MQIDKISQTSFKAVVIPQEARQSVQKYLAEVEDHRLLDVIEKACDEFSKRSDINIRLEKDCIPVVEAFGKRFGEYFRFADNKPNTMLFLTKCFDKSSADYGKQITVDLGKYVDDVSAARQKMRNVTNSNTARGTAIKRGIELVRILSEKKNMFSIEFYNPFDQIKMIFAKAKM